MRRGPLSGSPLALKAGQDIVTRDALVVRNCPQDGYQGTEAQWVVIRNGDPLVSGFICFEDDMTPDLMHFAVAPSAAKRVGELSAGQVAWNPHATDKISSRTK